MGALDLGIFLFPLLAIALGFKHAYDADHLLAVSNFLTRSRGFRETSGMTMSWAVGHMLTAVAIAIFLFVLGTRSRAFIEILGTFQFVVAVMLIGVGLFGILLGARSPLVHEHDHTHYGGKTHSHVHTHRLGRMHLHLPLLGVGVVQGLASNDELILIFIVGLGLGSLQALLGAVVLFTIGVMLGMILFGFVMTSALLSSVKKTRLQMVINTFAGSLSIAYGLMIILNLTEFNFIRI